METIGISSQQPGKIRNLDDVIRFVNELMDIGEASIDTISKRLGWTVKKTQSVMITASTVAAVYETGSRNSTKYGVIEYDPETGGERTCKRLS